MALCNITGTLYLPDGQPARSRTVIFDRADRGVKSEYLGAVVPERVITKTNSGGELDFWVLSGVYAITVAKEYFATAVIPDIESALISDILDIQTLPEMPPTWYLQVMDARSDAIEAADQANQSAADATAAADAAGVYAGQTGDDVLAAQQAATNAAASEDAAAQSATDAAASQSAAESARDDAEAAADSITGMTVATGAPGSEVTWDGSLLTVPRGDTGDAGPSGQDGADGESATITVFTDPVAFEAYAPGPLELAVLTDEA